MKIKLCSLFFIILSFTLMTIASVPNDTPTSTISVSSIKAHRGDTTNIVISLTNPKESYNGFQMDLRLPEGISLCKSRRNSYLYELSERFKGAQPSVVIKEQENGMYRILAFSFSQMRIEGHTGPILTFPIVTNPKMRKGKYHATLTDIIFNKKDNNGTTMDDVDFVIKVK